MKDGKKLKKRNIIGAAVMAGLIFAAMPMGVAHSMEDLRDEAENTYYYDNAGYAIYEGLEKRREAAHNLITLAQKYTEAHPELVPYVQDLEYQVQANENAYDDTFYWEGATNAEMGAAAEALAGELEKLPLEEKDRKYPAQMMAQMRSEQDKIERSSYNDAAREFNARLEKFPVNILRGFTDVKELIPFDEHAAAAEGTAAADEAVREDTGETTVEESVREPEYSESAVEAWADALAGRAESWAEGYAEKIEDRVEQAVTDALGS